ncbi:uncharacterized protein YukE [Actinoplanes lutulentus]|uniref:Excreted virulence factor EspC (Type VII ESX diderm) n=1 Tax=Actinoplanes lutulentus TaxID=1287878 RepID=A0A327Z2S6_9ACTN|nr:hypothetical protein [Actinoplanes lutulentus]MBB2943268.1 uncharacterized protein YukE [Actinoplanes lutulentus]RAK28328.1 hypothetical protein B0I29_12096 [Actinoplanes lutulentus]
MDVNGINRLYNQLLRASDDATDTLSYVKQHCNLDFLEVGMLSQLFSPHEKAYTELTAALTRLSSLAQAAGSQVNRAQIDYQRTDQEAAAALDAAYPGAKDPVALNSALTEQREDLQASHPAFADVSEPTRLLRNPEYAIGIEMWSINPMADLVSPSAWLRQTIIWVFGHDPFEGWASQFSGDWKGYVHCGNAMGQAGGVAAAIGRNLLAGVADVPEAWRGNAADGFREFELTLATAAVSLEQVCQDYNRLYDQAAEAIKKLYDVAASAIGDLLDMLLVISGCLAAGTATIETILGPIAGYSIAAYYAWQAYDLYKQISTFFGAAEDTIKLISGSLMTLDASLSVKDIPEVQPYAHPAGYR